MFQTKVEITPSEIKITYEDKILALGSCFAENMGKKMQDLYFDSEINPFGVLYNPVSIKNSLELMLEDKLFDERDLFENNGLWQSFSHSSMFSDTSVEKCLDKINSRLQTSTKFLKESNFLIITFGTAWIFEERKSGRVVSNCHKLPASAFNRRRLTTDEIVTSYSNLIDKLTNKLPNLKLIFSVSPVRHWKDGAHDNNLSKSTLLLAIEELTKRFPSVLYFPAYEIQMDELRDYRFYASDMLHPSDVAIDYIWSHFSDTYFDENTLKIKNDVERLISDLSHRPLFPDSEEFKKFKLSLDKKRSDLLKKYPILKDRIHY